MLSSFVQGEEIPAIDRLVTEAIQSGRMPGAVVLVGQGDRLLHRKAYGNRQVQPDAEPMTLDTVFDLASLTKPIATATSVLMLIQEGKIDPLKNASFYLPEFGNNGKEAITVDQLLTHTSGVIADNSIRDYQSGVHQSWEKICQLNLVAPPGEKFIYSDVGYIVLGKLVEAVSGQPLEQYCAQHLFQPLQMNEAGYLPAESLVPRIAPTERFQGNWLRGTVHDPRARALGGVAGHAGLFSTADDLSRYARMILNSGQLEGNQVLQPETVQAMLVSRPVPPNGIRTWGWDRQSPYSGNRGKGMNPLAIGHGGFTGTGIWIDPESGLYVIFLSSRLHPDGKGAVNSLIGTIGTEAVKSLP
ncbi:MAG TPA: serine hydrolase domain-containing protein [Planctomicrobium sp.]|nr:serine hydrolase domain-containing protein [Planctomicrobium sp.]